MMKVKTKKKSKKEYSNSFLSKFFISTTSVFVYNAIIISLLLTPRIREKLLTILLNTLPNTKRLTPVIIPLIHTLPSILTFVNRYHNLALLALGNISIATITSLLFESVGVYKDITDNSVKFFKISENMKNELLEELPGKWKEQSITKFSTPKTLRIANNISKSIEDINVENKKEILSVSEYIKLSNSIIPGSFL